MAITPTQERYVDPYSDIFSDKVDRRLMSIYPTGNGLITGLLVTYDNSDLTKITITSGIAVKDYVTLQFPANTDYDISSLGDGEYYVVIRYSYNKTNPAPSAEYDVIPTTSLSGELILAKIRIASNQLDTSAYTSFITPDGNYDYNGVSSAVSYDDRNSNAIQELFNHFLAGGYLQNDLDMTNHKILRLGIDGTSITHDLDAVNKIYVDTQVSHVAGGIHVKTDSQDSTAQFLDDKLIMGDNITKQLLNSDLSPATSGNPHVLQLTAIDEKVEITSGDSQSSYLDSKISEGDGIKTEVVSGGSGQALEISVLSDNDADGGTLSSHGGQKSINVQNITSGGNTSPGIYVADIFVHKTGSINEIITGEKTFQNDIRIDNVLKLGSSTRISGVSTSALELYNAQSSAFLSVQDGNGRIQLKWNATFGTSETYLVGSENAARWEFDPSTPGNELFRIDFGNGSGAGAGDTISWQNVLQIGNTNFVYNGSNATFNSSLTVNGNTSISGNLDVSGNITSGGGGLNADTLDGLDSSQFLRSDVDDTANGNITFAQNVIVQGDLTVQGTTTTIDTQNLQIEDNDILLNRGESGSGVSEGEAGITIDRGSASNAWLRFNESRDRWTIYNGNTASTYQDIVGSWVVATNSSNNTYWYRLLDISGSVNAQLRVDYQGNSSYSPGAEIHGGTIFLEIRNGSDVNDNLSVRVYQTGDTIQGIKAVKGSSEYRWTVYIQVGTYTGLVAQAFGNATFTPYVDNYSSSDPGGVDKSSFIYTLYSSDGGGSGSGINADLLDGYDSTYYLNYNNLTNKPTIGDGQITINGTSGLTGSGSFTVNQTNDTTINIQHSDTSSTSSTSNANGVVIQNINIDTYGHITSFGTLNLDNRYYTESEADSRFLRKDANDTATGTHYYFTSTADAALSSDGVITIGSPSGTNMTIDSNEIMVRDNGNASYMYLNDYGGQVRIWYSVSANGQNPISVGNEHYKVWHAGNDGSGSGLDADLLDGHDSGYYLNYNNLNNKPTIGNGQITINSGSGLSGSGSFTVNQTSNTTITLQHDDTSNVSSVSNSNGNVIQSLSFDTYGHVTNLSSTNLDTRYYTKSESDSRFININSPDIDSTLTEKTNPVDNDILLIEDSEDSYNKKKVLVGNIGGSSGSGIIILNSSDFYPDDTYTGINDGSYLGIFSTVDFESDNDGALHTQFILPEGWDSGTVAINLYYHFEVQNYNDVYINVKIDAISSGTNNINNILDNNYTLSCTSANYGNLLVLNITGLSLPDDSAVHIYVRRLASNSADTYNGKWQLLNITSNKE